MGDGGSRGNARGKVEVALVAKDRADVAENELQDVAHHVVADARREGLELEADLGEVVEGQGNVRVPVDRIQKVDFDVCHFRKFGVGEGGVGEVTGAENRGEGAWFHAALEARDRGRDFSEDAGNGTIGFRDLAR